MSVMHRNNLLRFGCDSLEDKATWGRVQDYDRYRPGYPHALVDLVESQLGVRSTDIIADVGCGTGLFSRPFLARGYAVWGVEPDDLMLDAARSSLAKFPRFQVTLGSAESTGLPDGCVKLVTVAQAIHWFNRSAAKREFARILAPNKKILVAWNERDRSAPVSLAYDRLRREIAPNIFWTPCEPVFEHDLEEFFAPRTVSAYQLPNSQLLDRDHFLGRVRSAAGAPPRESSIWALLEEALNLLFDSFSKNGILSLPMITQLRWGR